MVCDTMENSSSPTNMENDTISGNTSAVVPATVSPVQGDTDIAIGYRLEQIVLVTIFAVLTLLFLIQTIYKYLLHRKRIGLIEHPWAVNVKTTFLVCGLISASLTMASSLDFKSELGLVSEELIDLFNIYFGFSNTLSLFAYIYVAVRSLALGRSFDASLYYERGIVVGSLLLYFVACTVTSVLLFITHVNWPKCIYASSSATMSVLIICLLNWSFANLSRSLNIFSEGTPQRLSVEKVIKRWKRFTIITTVLLTAMAALQGYWFYVNFRDRTVPLNARHKTPGVFYTDPEEYLLYVMEFGWLSVTLWFSW
eukprot:976771_1